MTEYFQIKCCVFTVTSWSHSCSLVSKLSAHTREPGNEAGIARDEWHLRFVIAQCNHYSYWHYSLTQIWENYMSRTLKSLKNPILLYLSVLTSFCYFLFVILYLYTSVCLYGFLLVFCYLLLYVYTGLPGKPAIGWRDISCLKLINQSINQSIMQ